jgi:deoxyribodipyrimidine photo-lyase
MYWAKQVPLWSASAEEAFEILVALNDRYFVDGRDPNGYAGIAWSVGGRHDRPFPPERPITGLVRRMGVNALKKHFKPQDYIDQWPDESPAMSTQSRIDGF